MRCACSETISGNPRLGRTRRRIYEEAERNALVVLWVSSDRIYGKRLKALLPLLIESMERNAHMGLAPEIRTKLLVMRASTIDRALGKIQPEGGRQSVRRWRAHCDGASRYGR